MSPRKVRVLRKALRRHWHWLAVAATVLLYLMFNACEWMAVCP